jgi:hypothetical protein
LAIACRNKGTKTHIRITEKAVRIRSGFLVNTVYRTLLNRVCMYYVCMYVFMTTAVYTQSYACYFPRSNKADTQGQCDPTRRDINDK